MDVKDTPNGPAAGKDVAAAIPEPRELLRLFLKDRFWYIVAFYIALVFVVLVVTLERMRDGFVPDIGNHLYMLVLATVVLAGWLGWDYVRQRSYFNQVRSILAERVPEMDAPLRITSAVTLEQQALQQVVERQYRAYMERLSDYRRQREQHLHFTYQWVHHIKTPVSVINLLTQQAAELPEDAGGKELLASVQEENERISRGLDMMLHTARLEQFHLDVRLERVSLLPLVRKVINGHKKSLIRSSIFPQIEGEDAIVETDAKWLSFVLDQLVTNAIKYSKDKPGSKRLFLAVKAEDGGCSLSVTDDGIGIAEQELPRIFDAFFTGENGRLVEESTGMGLYLTKQVCSRLGHGISANSELGAGTTVTLTFAGDSLHKDLNVTTL